MASEADNPVTAGRQPRGRRRWLFGFAIAGFTGPFLLTAFGAIAQLLHIGPKYPKFIEVLAKVLASSWFSLFLLQGAREQRDVVIWWLPCVAVNVGLYSLIGLVSWWIWRGFNLRRKLTVSAGLLGCVLLGVLAFLLGWWGQPVLWELPVGYRGWVVVQYEDSACPPLPRRGIYKVIAVDPAGRLCTSSPMPTGFRYLRFEYVNPSGTKQVMLSGWYGFLDVRTPQVSTAGVVEGVKRQVLFVGTDEERKGKEREFPWL